MRKLTKKSAQLFQNFMRGHNRHPKNYCPNHTSSPACTREKQALFRYLSEKINYVSFLHRSTTLINKGVLIPILLLLGVHEVSCKIQSHTKRDTFVSCIINYAALKGSEYHKHTRCLKCFK